METSVMDVTKIGNIMSRVCIEPTSMVIRAIMLTITQCHHCTHAYLSMWLLA